MTFITTSHNKFFDDSLNNTVITEMRSYQLELGLLVYWYTKVLSWLWHNLRRTKLNCRLRYNSEATCFVLSILSFITFYIVSSLLSPELTYSLQHFKHRHILFDLFSPQLQNMVTYMYIWHFFKGNCFSRTYKLYLKFGDKNFNT